MELLINDDDLLKHIHSTQTAVDVFCCELLTVFYDFEPGPLLQSPADSAAAKMFFLASAAACWPREKVAIADN